MMTLTTTLAAMIPTDLRAKMLMCIDDYLRQNLNDEDLFESWLMCGVPDGTENWKELGDIEIEEFVEMWNLAERLMNTQAANERTFEHHWAGAYEEPDDIDSDMGYDPYEGCYTGDC